MATSITRRQIREGAAHDLSMLVTGSADSLNASNHTMQISDLRLKLPDKFAVRDAWVMSRATNFTGNEYFHIVNWQENMPDTVLLDSGPVNINTSDSVGVYTLLSPEDWNDCINEALEELWKPFRVTIAVTDNDNQYSMDSITDSENHSCTWLQSRNQIYAIRTRYTDGANYAEERDWAGVRFIEDNNQLTVMLTYLPTYVSNYSLILECQKPYVWQDNLMTSDTDTTNCPYKLAMAAVKVEVCKKLWNRHGSEAMRPRFGAAFNQAQLDLVAQKGMYMPQMKPVGYQIDEPFYIDIPEELLYPSW